MDGALTSGAAALLLGALLLAVPAAAVEVEPIFVADGYRYVSGSTAADQTKADLGLALCGTRCNALSGNYDSFLETMNYRLTKVADVTERVVELNNPFLDGRCVCTGTEYRVEFFFYRPGNNSSSGATAPEPRGDAPAGGQTEGAAQ